MPKPKLVRITTVPISLEKLLEGQLEYMQQYFEVTAISADRNRLELLGKSKQYATFHVEMTRQITPWKDVKAVVKLYKYLKRERPNIVHTHTPKAGIVGMMAAWLARVPNRLHTVAGLPLMETTGIKRHILNLVEKLTYSFATKVYPNSKGLKEFILSENLTKPNKLKIIGHGSSNGIDTDYFDPTEYNKKAFSVLGETLGITEKDFVFIFVGRLVGDKGINELVRAFVRLLKDKNISDSIKLLLVGPFEDDLDPLHLNTINEIETNGNIISVGFQNDVRPYFALADVLVFPSYREGFPNVVMQAGALEIPAIVSNINGCNEIIQNDKNGLIIPSKDIISLEAAMKRIIQDKELYLDLKFNSRKMIVSRYKRAEIWESLWEEYSTFLNKES